MINLLNQIGTQWMSYFGLIVLQNTIFLGFIFFALYLLRNTSAKIRYTLLLIGLFKCLTPPFWSAPILDIFKSTNEATLSTVTIGTVTQMVLPTESVTRLEFSGLLFGLWFLIGMITLTIPTMMTIRLRWRLKNAEPVHSKNFQMNILKSDRISMPLSLGIFPKKIYVPEIWQQWTPACREMILKHELAHIQRKDGFVQTIQILIQAIYFFHPLIWLLSRKLNEIREMACDDASLGNEKNSTVEYSGYLVDIAKNLVHGQIGCSSASALIKQKNELLKRVQYQIKEENIKKTSKLFISLTFSVLIFMIIPFSCAQEKSGPTNTNMSIESGNNIMKQAVIAVDETNNTPPSPPSPPQPPPPEDVTFVPYDEPPQPVDGFNTIQENLIYPEIARKAGIEGRVTICVHIDELGKVTKAKVQKSLGPNGCDEAAIKAIKSVKWTPAKQRDNPVAVWIAIPIDFI